MADVFENFRKLRLKIYYLNPEKLLSASGLACQAVFRKTKIKLELLIHTDMLLMVEKETIEGIYLGIPQCVKANNKYMKEYDKNKK